MLQGRGRLTLLWAFLPERKTRRNYSFVEPLASLGAPSSPLEEFPLCTSFLLGEEKEKEAFSSLKPSATQEVEVSPFFSSNSGHQDKEKEKKAWSSPFEVPATNTKEEEKKRPCVFLSLDLPASQGMRGNFGEEKKRGRASVRRGAQGGGFGQEGKKRERTREEVFYRAKGREGMGVVGGSGNNYPITTPSKIFHLNSHLLTFN